MGSAGAYRLGPEAGRLLVKRPGQGWAPRPATISPFEATRWHGSATVDAATPTNSSVTVEVEVDSLEVREGTGGVKPLTDADRTEIKKTLGEILNTAQHPTITFRSRRVEGSAGSFTCDGELTIMSVTRPVLVEGRVADGRVVGGASVVQSRWGIRPTRRSLPPSSSAMRSRLTSTWPSPHG